MGFLRSNILRWNETRPQASAVALSAWTAAMAAIVIAYRTLPSTMPIIAFLLVGLLPALALMSPALLAYIALRAGRVTAIACAAVSAALCALYIHPYVALALALIQLPAAVFAVYSYERARPFWPSVAICVGIPLVSGMAALIAANALAGGDAIAWLSDTLDPLVRSSAETDRLLLVLASMGYVRLPESVVPGIQLGSAVVLDAPVRDELIKQFLFFAESLLRQGLAGVILQSAILGGLLCAAWPRRVAARYATQMATAPMPPFHEWFVPMQIFIPMMGTVLALGLLMLLSGAQAMIDIFYLFWAGVSVVMALQGGALLVFIMRRGGAKPATRVSAVIALMVLANFMLLALGFADQLFNLRMMRKPTNDKRDEEDD